MIGIDVRTAFVRACPWVLVLACLLGLAACAPVRPAGPGLATLEEAWNRFRTLQESTDRAQSFLLQASVNYDSPMRKNRVFLTFFGNYDYPLRLDLSAGMGNPIGFWREDPSGWMAYYPSEKTAYFHQNPRLGSAALGFETPFSLYDLASMLGGRYSALVPTGYAKARRSKEGFEYLFPSDAQVRSLVLDNFGRPVALTGFDSGPGSAPWHIELSDFQEPASPAGAQPDAPPSAEAYAVARPMTLTLTRAPETAVVRIKKLDTSRDPRPEPSLTLPLPPGTRLERLDENR